MSSPPLTLPASPLVPAEAHRAVERLNALSNLQVIVVTSAGIECPGVIQIAGNTAILRIQLR